jgi:hypothetical protein
LLVALPSLHTFGPVCRNRQNNQALGHNWRHFFQSMNI